jgi:hypothetical protein
MNIDIAKKPPTLVVILAGNEYQRYIGKTLTNHVKSDRPLTADEVEKFRVSPESIMEPESE